VGTSTSEEQIKYLAKTLHSQFQKEKVNNVRTVFTMIAKQYVLEVDFVAPRVTKSLGIDVKGIENKEWKIFNKGYLNQTLRRLSKQKEINMYEKKGKVHIELTDKGKNKVIKLALDNFAVKKPLLWDGKWRLVVFDIPEKNRKLANAVRNYLYSWGFFKFQNSVYLHAYPCEEVISILRSLLRAEEYVQVLEISKIENDRIFRDYFDV